MPTLTLSQSTHDNGVLMYTVLYQGMPLMASTPEKDRAWQLMDREAKKLTRPNVKVSLMHWDGDKGVESTLEDFVRSEGR